MRNLFLSSLILAAVLGASPVVSAQPSQNLSQAIALCRTSVAEQAGVTLDRVRFDQARQRAHNVRVDVNLWSGDGRLTNVRCDVAVGEQLTIASISPALHTATAQR